MKSVINILLQIKNANTKNKIYSILQMHNLHHDNIGIYYNLDNYEKIYIY